MEIVKSFDVVNAPLRVPRKSSRWSQAYMLREVVVKGDGHRIRLYIVPGFVDNTAADIGVPVFCEGMEGDRSIKSIPT